MSHPSSSQFVPPQSAQQYRSIFGGSSSQNVPNSEPPHVLEDGSYEDNEFDVLMKDQPLVPNGSDDDDTYEESDAEESEDSMNTKSTRRTSRRRKSTSAMTMNQRVIESPSPSPPSYRPNRFHGPEPTWRKLTLEDRQNAEALEDLRAKDLAAHLYNAYALRARAREIAKRAAEMGGGAADGEPFLPPKRWAAWPVPANEVPRGDEHHRDDETWTLKMPADPRPSADLEESIMALMLRHAKERFNARPWRSTRPTSPSPFDPASQAETQDDSAAAEDAVKVESDFMDASIPLRPVVQADDDRSRKQLRPITRNIITEFDRLLLGLHHARKNVTAGDDSSASEWQTDTESIASGSSVSARRKRTSQNETSRSQSRGRKRTRKSSRGSSTGPRSRSALSSRRASSASQSTYQPSQSSRSRGRSSGSDRRQPAARKLRIGFRDWSEILGVASMVGWPPAVVMRTAQRCGALFREDMAYRTFKEGKLQQTEAGNPAAWEYAESDTGFSEVSVEPLPQRKLSRSRAASPREGSTSRPVSTEPEGAANKRAGGRPKGKGGRPKRENDRPRGKGEHRKQDLVCPFRSCSRHTNGFSRTWNLNVHLKRMHPGYASRDGTKSPAVVVEDDTDND
ncbi:RNA polymerase I-specific transcription initiation factor-domain-containing protein [Aspergillus floccosus]